MVADLEQQRAFLARALKNAEKHIESLGHEVAVHRTAHTAAVDRAEALAQQLSVRDERIENLEAMLADEQSKSECLLHNMRAYKADYHASEAKRREAAARLRTAIKGLVMLPFRDDAVHAVIAELEK